MDKEDIHQMKHEEVEVVDQEDFGAAIIDFIKEMRPPGNKNVRTAISRQERIEIKVDIRRGPIDDVLSKQLNLKQRDFQTLSGTEFLNDRIIDEYMRLIWERNQVNFSLRVVYTCII